MKKITGLMMTKKDIGLVLSVSYTEIDEKTGQITSANQTKSKLLLQKNELSKADAVFELAQQLADSEV